MQLSDVCLLNKSGSYLVKMWGEWFEVEGEIENSLCLILPTRHFDKITKEFIKKITNLESMRLLRDKIGLERYIQLLDAIVINEQVDNQGFQMKLYQFIEQKEKVIILECICPSTNRMYHLYPPNQKAKTCFEAKRSTFNNKGIKYRHGDVSLLQVGFEYEYPLSES